MKMLRRSSLVLLIGFVGIYAADDAKKLKNEVTEIVKQIFKKEKDVAKAATALDSIFTDAKYASLASDAGLSNDISKKFVETYKKDLETTFIDADLGVRALTFAGAQTWLTQYVNKYKANIQKKIRDVCWKQIESLMNAQFKSNVTLQVLSPLIIQAITAFDSKYMDAFTLAGVPVTTQDADLAYLILKKIVDKYKKELQEGYVDEFVGAVAQVKYPGSLAWFERYKAKEKENLQKKYTQKFWALIEANLNGLFKNKQSLQNVATIVLTQVAELDAKYKDITTFAGVSSVQNDVDLAYNIMKKVGEQYKKELKDQYENELLGAALSIKYPASEVWIEKYRTKETKKLTKLSTSGFIDDCSKVMNEIFKTVQDADSAAEAFAPKAQEIADRYEKTMGSALKTDLDSDPKLVEKLVRKFAEHYKKELQAEWQNEVIGAAVLIKLPGSQAWLSNFMKQRNDRVEEIIKKAIEKGSSIVVKNFLDAKVIDANARLAFKTKPSEFRFYSEADLVRQDKFTPLLVYALERHIIHAKQKQIIKDLVAAGADVNVTLDYETPLSDAVLSGDPEIVTLLLDNKADVNGKTPQGTTALLTAATFGQKDMVALLLQRGAQVDIRTQEGQTPLMGACSQGFTEVAQRLLDAGASANAQDDDGFSPLMYAVRHDKADLLQLLFAKGANLNLKTKFNDTALSLAKRAEKAIHSIKEGKNKKFPAVALLTQKGALDTTPVPPAKKK